jgi:hypothetical protein
MIGDFSSLLHRLAFLTSASRAGLGVRREYYIIFTSGFNKLQWARFRPNDSNLRYKLTTIPACAHHVSLPSMVTDPTWVEAVLTLNSIPNEI